MKASSKHTLANSNWYKYLHWNTTANKKIPWRRCPIMKLSAGELETGVHAPQLGFPAQLFLIFSKASTPASGNKESVAYFLIQMPDK